MTNENLKELILRSYDELFCLVGPNSSGKTYFMRNLFDEVSNAFYFDENAFCELSEDRDEVGIFDNYYLYKDRNRKGREYNAETLREEINRNSLNIIEFINNTKREIDLIHKSLGTQKINRLFNAFSKYNLNNISYVFFDEPENYLDDNNLKIISRFIQILRENGKNVVIATHSPRMLFILKILPEKIFLFNKLFEDIINLSFTEIKEIFDQNGEDIVRFMDANGIGDDHSNKYKYLPNTLLREIYLMDLVTSLEYYQALFYDSVSLVEGFTEHIIIKEISDEIDSSKNFLVCNGKYTIPFLVKLFVRYKKHISCFIDSDSNITNNKAPLYLTEYLKEIKDPLIKVHVLPENIEKFLNLNPKADIKILINNEEAGLLEKISKNYKHYLCLWKIKEDKIERQKIINLFQQKGDIDIDKEYNIFE